MITGINHITLSVINLNKSFNFYTQVLDCKPIARWKLGAYLLAGDLWLCLSLDKQTRLGTSPEYTHIGLNVAAKDFERFRHKIIESGATIWKQNTSEGLSLYFLDPNGHKLELHAGDLNTRIEATKKQPYEEMEFFV